MLQRWSLDIFYPHSVVIDPSSLTLNSIHLTRHLGFTWLAKLLLCSSLGYLISCTPPHLSHIPTSPKPSPPPSSLFQKVATLPHLSFTHSLEAPLPSQKVDTNVTLSVRPSLAISAKILSFYLTLQYPLLFLNGLP